MLSDDELVEQILLGNENAAEELIKRYYTSILRYCRWHCSNLEKAEDLTQETFLKLFKNLSGYKGKKKFKAYLYTIANHLCIDESRKVEFYPLEDEENIVHEYNDIVRLEDRAEISYFLNFLSSEQREAVILRFGEQLSFGEIAKVMGCNMRTAQSRVRNALKIMRKEVKKMDKNELCKKVSAGMLLVTMSLYATPVFAYSKDETVYSKLNSEGNSYKTKKIKKINFTIIQI